MFTVEDLTIKIDYDPRMTKTLFWVSKLPTKRVTAAKLHHVSWVTWDGSTKTTNGRSHYNALHGRDIAVNFFVFVAFVWKEIQAPSRHPRQGDEPVCWNMLKMFNSFPCRRRHFFYLVPHPMSLHLLLHALTSHPRHAMQYFPPFLLWLATGFVSHAGCKGECGYAERQHVLFEALSGSR